MRSGEVADLDPRVLPLIQQSRRAGLTWHAVAGTLNEAALKTSTGRTWTMQTARLAAVDRNLFIARHLDGGMIDAVSHGDIEIYSTFSKLGGAADFERGR